MDLWGVIIGGLIATISASVVPALQHNLARKAKLEEERKAAQRDLILVVHQHGEWQNRRIQNALFDGKYADEPNPIGKLAALVEVDCPHARLEFHSFSVGASEIEKWLVDRKKEKLMQQPMDVSGYSDVYQAYIDARSAIITKAVSPNLDIDRSASLGSNIKPQ